MLIELRAPDRLRGQRAMDLSPMLSSVLQAARDSSADLTRLRVVCDWVQYKENFREPIAIRRIVPSEYEAAQASRSGYADRSAALEVAIDLRRARSAGLQAELTGALAGDGATSGRVYLEPWVPGSRSCIWDFNALYWRALSLWEQASGHEYEQALPGGESDARNAEGARELIQGLFAVWDELAARRALPEELYVLELGVGNGNQARVWLDEFVRMERELGRDYYRRLHYLMGDYSPHVLERARMNVSHHEERTSGLVLNAMHPTQTLGFLRYKVFLVYISNVYDNLPTDEVARIGGHLFRVQVRTFLPGEVAEQIAQETGIAVDDVSEQIARLLRLAPELLSEASPAIFPKPLAAVEFWRRVWGALRLEERYVPIEGLDMYEVAPGVSGEILRPLIEANGDLRMHVSNGAATSFIDTLPLLHAQGLLCCHDLFVTDTQQYLTSFRGPGKYDGSVVNWVNGPLLSAIGRRHGYDVRFSEFGHRAGSNVLTLTTRPLE